MEIYSSALKNYRKHGSFVADLEQVQELICHYTIKKLKNWYRRSQEVLHYN